MKSSIVSSKGRHPRTPAMQMEVSKVSHISPTGRVFVYFADNRQFSTSRADPHRLTFEDVDVPEGFCRECHIPLAPDPKPESLFIYLHAWRYTTDALGTWATPMYVFSAPLRLQRWTSRLTCLALRTAQTQMGSRRMGWTVCLDVGA